MFPRWEYELNDKTVENTWHTEINCPFKSSPFKLFKALLGLSCYLTDLGTEETWEKNHMV